MGTVAQDEEKERDPSETSGYADIMEIAQSLGIEDDEIAASSDDDDDDLDDGAGTGYGGAAAAALIGDAALEAPPPVAANTTRPTSESKPPPPPPPKPKTGEVPKAEAAADAPKAEPKAEAKPEPKPEAKADSKPVAAAVSLAEVAPKAEPKTATVAVPAPLPKTEHRATAAAVTMTPAPAPKQEEQRKGGMLWMLALGALVLGGVAWVAMRPDSDANKTAAAGAEVRAAAPTPPPVVEPKPEPPKPAPVVVPPPVVEEPVVEEPPPVVEEPPKEAKVEVSVTQKKKGEKKPAAGPPEPSGPPEPAEPKSLTPKEIDERFRAECVLDPNKPGCAELRKKERNGPDLDAKLADKLSESQLRQGFSSAKAKAKACGGSAGETVRVKVSIAGDSGDVISASALDPHAGTPLGECVASALKDAHFSRFTSETQGTVYPVSF